MKRLILFLLLIPALCFGDMNPYIAGRTVSSGWAGFSDNFNRTDGALGANWSVTYGGVLIDTNIVHYTTKSASNSAVAVLATNPTLSSGMIEGDVNEEGSSYRRPGLVFWYTDTANYWFATIYGSGSENIQLIQVSSNTPTVIDSATFSINLVTTYDLRVVFADDGVDIYLDDTLRVEDTTARSNSGNIGIGFMGSSEQGWIDNFNATD